MKIKSPILLVILFTICQFSFSQSNIEFQQLSGDNMPTQSITYAIDQDSDGNLWIASEEGVIKYNSKFCKVYNTYNGLPEILSNRTTAIFIDSKQRKWIGLQQGVCIYNEDLDKFQLVQSYTDINPTSVNSINEDSKGNIWIGGFNGLWKYSFDEKNNKLNRLVNNQNIHSLVTYNNKIIFGSKKGVFSYNTTSDVLRRFKLNTEYKNIWLVTIIDNSLYIGTNSGQLLKIDINNNIIKGEISLKTNLINPITDIIKNSNDGIYVSTDGGGIFQLDESFSVINHFTENVNDEHSLSSNGVYNIKIDKEGILWVATFGGGLNYFDANRLAFFNIKHRINDQNSIVSDFTRSVARDKNGNIWFGTKKGVSIWNPKNNTWKHIEHLSKKMSLSEDIILALEPDEEFMWIGTYNKGLFKTNINTLKSIHYNSLISKSNLLNKIFTIYKDSNKNIWVGGVNGDIAIININNEVVNYPIRDVKSFCETKSGHILVSGIRGVHEINHLKREFKLIEDLAPNTNMLAYSNINLVYETNDERLILATNGEGLIFYNPRNSKIDKLKINEGMPSDIVQGMVIENDSNIWASTTKGLVHLKTTKKDTVINIFDKNDGLASTEFNYGSYSKLNDSLFAFGGISGITLLNPDNIKAMPHKPKLVFDEFKLSNKVIETGNKPLTKQINKTRAITIPYKDNSFEIAFTGISHSSPSKIKYSWKLEGFDIDWTTPNFENYATFTNLNSGNYIFRVKAFNKYGIAGDERKLNLEILAPWWATNQALVLYVIVFIIAILAIVHFTSVIVKKRHADEQIDFLNNVTHEIKTPLAILISSLDSVIENDGSGNESKKRIKATVKRINLLFEQMLNFQRVTSVHNNLNDISKFDLYHLIKNRVNNFKPLTEERNIEIIINNDWKESSFHYNEDVFDKILLNIISNAIKYSLENGKIFINTYKNSKNALVIEIIDEGLGIPKNQQKYILKNYYRARNAINSQRPGTGLGLMIVKKMLEKIGGTIDFKSEENKGTKFILTLQNLKKEFEKNQNTSKDTIDIILDKIEDQAELDAYSDSKILIVEDNDELRGILVNILSVHFQVFEATNGKEGLKTASQIFPDIILTDLIMPIMDGMQMSRKLNDDINLNHIPVFMLTVLQNTEHKLESIESGISEYIEKPVDMKFLLAKIINTLKWQQKLREKYIHDNEADSALLFRNKNDQEFLKGLEENVIKNIESKTFSVHDLSNSYNMSRSSFYNKLKNLVDLSPQDFIMHTKLKYAKQLLIKGELNIKEVAYSIGFSNPKYFSTCFKKFYDTTPTEFLENLKK